MFEPLVSKIISVEIIILIDYLYDQVDVIHYYHINTLSAKDGDLRLSASHACLRLPKTEISVFLTECVFFTSTCYKLHMFTLHDVLYERRNVPHYFGIKQYLFGLASLL